MVSKNDLEWTRHACEKIVQWTCRSEADSIAEMKGTLPPYDRTKTKTPVEKLLEEVLHDACHIATLGDFGDRIMLYAMYKPHTLKGIIGLSLMAMTGEFSDENELDALALEIELVDRIGGMSTFLPDEAISCAPRNDAQAAWHSIFRGTAWRTPWMQHSMDSVVRYVDAEITRRRKMVTDADCEGVLRVLAKTVAICCPREV